MSLIETQETDTHVQVNEIAHLLKISQDTSYDEINIPTSEDKET